MRKSVIGTFVLFLAILGIAPVHGQPGVNTKFEATRDTLIDVIVIDKAERAATREARERFNARAERAAAAYLGDRTDAGSSGAACRELQQIRREAREHNNLLDRVERLRVKENQLHPGSASRRPQWRRPEPPEVECRSKHC